MEYGSSLPATRAFGIVRSLYDTVYNMNLAHLSRAHKTVFEHLDDAGLRTACTTYLIYRGRTRHEPSGASVYRRIAEAAQFRHAGLRGARALLRGPVRLARHRLHVRARNARPARPAHRLRRRLPGRERPVRLPALLAARTTTRTRTSVGPDGQVSSIAEADRALERIMHVAGGRRRSSRSTRSSSCPTTRRRRSRRASTSQRCSPTAACSRPATRRRPTPSSRLPVGSLGDGLRARRRPPRRARPSRRRRRCWRSTAWTSSSPRQRRGGRPLRARRAALRARRRPGGRARAALERGGRRGASLALAGAAACSRARPTPTPSAGSGRRSMPALPATCWSPPARLRVRGLGRRGPRGRRQPRLAAPR